MLNRTPIDRLFIDTVSSLLERTVLPNFQRVKDELHIDEIFQSIANNIEADLDPKITGCFITVMLNNTYYLLDGNHRIHAYERILNKYNYNLKIYVQEVEVSSIEDAELLFSQTNNNLPVSKMPTGVKRSDVNQIAVYFYNKYSKSGKHNPLFSTGNTHRPRLNKNKFEELLSNILKSNPELDAETVISRIEHYASELNRRTSNWFKRYTTDTLSKLEKMITKADTLGSRLGMVQLDDIGCIFKIRVHMYQRQKQHIPKKLKIKVWDRYCGATRRVSTCPFCKDNIMVEDFHCAHDIAECDGGGLTIDNLYPCCGACNLSMGTRTFDDFIKKWVK